MPGYVVSIVGDLGAGKTAFTKGIAKGLGIEEHITSPTFTIVNEYEGGRLNLYHFDVYRIEDADELYEIGFSEYLYAGGVCVIEWADRIRSALPENTLYVTINKCDTDTEREIIISK